MISSKPTAPGCLLPPTSSEEESISKESTLSSTTVRMHSHRLPHRPRHLSAQSRPSRPLWNQGIGHQLYPCWLGGERRRRNWQSSADGRSERLQSQDTGTTQGIGYLSLHVICLEQCLLPFGIGTVGWGRLQFLLIFTIPIYPLGQKKIKILSSEIHPQPTLSSKSKK